MSTTKIKRALKEFWHWLWNSESIWSYAVFILLVYAGIKFLFLPFLGLAFGGVELPLAIVESESMDHSYLKYCVSADTAGNSCEKWSADYLLCGQYSQTKNSTRFADFWEGCGKWYEKEVGITKEQFQNFSFKNGFGKGDILILTGYREPRLGDVVLFNPKSLAPRPVIHRIVSLSPLQTKGDHNQEQLKPSNNAYKTDETNIDESQIMGVATARIPYLGWGKLFFIEIWNKLT